MSNPQKVSACLLSWKRPQNMQKIVDHLRKLPFIDDIIIWNNNPQAELSVSGHDIHIVQSPRNMVTYGRFLATRYARNPIIYTQDDDCLVLDIPKLYSSFQEDPFRICHGLISNMYKERGKYKHSTAHMALVGWGGFFLKEWVSVFDSYVQHYSSDQILCSKADRIFSILLNREHNTEQVEIEDIGGTSGMEALWVQRDHQKKALIAEERALKLLGIAKSHQQYAPPSEVTRKFIVYSSGRSGSNYFCAVLDTHPDVLCHSELFHRDAIFNSHPLIPQKQMENTTWRDRHVDEFLLNVWKQNYGNEKVGFKMLHSHDWKVVLKLLADPSIANILLRRRNMVRQFVSLQIASKTNQWFLTKSKKRKFTTVHIDPKGLMQFVDGVNKFYARVRINLENSGQQRIEVCYEDVTGSRREEHFAKVFEHLGLNPLSRVETVSVKQNHGSLTELVENFDELKEFLNGTELEQYLYAEEVCSA